MAMLLSSASGASVLIDWSTAASVPVPAVDGKYWNSLGTQGPAGMDLAPTALFDVNNAATGFTVVVDNTVSLGGSSFGTTNINGPIGPDPFDEANAVVDGIFVNNNDPGGSTIMLTGLAASTQYDFLAIGGRASNGVDGLIGIAAGTSAFSNYNLLNDGTVASFSVTSTVGGTIAFNFIKATDATNTLTSATWNAMSFTAIPETSAAFLGGFGALLLLRRRRE